MGYQHYTRNTVEADAWCNRCGRRTMHRVDGVKLGPCLACTEKLETQHQEKQHQQEDYEERAAIKEFCGNQPREQAEQEAREEIFGKGQTPKLF
jgi:ribosomal protein L37E